MLKGTVKCVVFSSIDQISFDPDVLVVTTDNADQARIILRALVYSSGEPWSSRGTPVLACTWLYIYPYLTGEVNYTVTGLSMGMQALNVTDPLGLPQGLMILSIPWVKLPMIMKNLEKMNWHPISEIVGGEEHKKHFYALLDDIKRKIQA